ncbi:hypothetical protein HanRHA438_Chr05g0238351 [Helianthus annuus]|uniref:Uncharacterized protein n=1 Tax=Helianthus annuus TaxID=4232 RepID=A0A9K3J1W3_HELAN|nr:hypothetical protein HanXRQr2_Chr05g0229301 [Helianthus annuus]KAJ0920166.1 hypothetical protein HanRHA438_Chr05g0238351 [Helianthus annuus]KAJ0923829.1 hypothetical protein HanPSC8_Chr05g0221221 [Helianthus annuus]
MALKQIGLGDVVAVELFDSPPLALFPARYVRELERVVRVGSVVVVCVEECGESGVREVLRLFGWSEVVWVGNLTIVGSKMMRLNFNSIKTNNDC